MRDKAIAEKRGAVMGRVMGHQPQPPQQHPHPRRQHHFHLDLRFFGERSTNPSV